jgi:hypothetical protein
LVMKSAFAPTPVSKRAKQINTVAGDLNMDMDMLLF